MKTALVTGANQGLGLALVRGLARFFGSEGRIFLGARDVERGRNAVAGLAREGLGAKLLPLDVTDDASVRAAAEFIRSLGGVDVLISNAAARITKDAPASAQVRTFVDTNNHGTYRIIDAFAALLKDDARFLIVASGFGSLRNLDPKLWPLFDTTARTLEDVERTMDDYVEAVEKGTSAQAGWPEWINIPSKIGQVASARILARRMAGRRGILINAVCPGLVDTDASRPWFDDMTAAQSPDDAAKDVIWLATVAAGTTTPQGELVQHRKLIPWT